MNMIRSMAVLSVFAILVASLAFTCGENGPGGVIEASGFIEATQVRVSTQISGTVTELLAVEGERVQKGSLLAVLERKDLAEQLAAAEAALSGAGARRGDMEAGARRQEIRQAEAALEQAGAQYKKAVQDTARYRQLYSQEAAAEAMYDDVMTKYEVAGAQVKQAEERLALLKAGTRPKQILASKAAETQAEKSYDALKATYAYTRIESPISGVVQVKNAEQGEVVPPNFPVYTLLNPDDLWVRVYIPETEIPRIKPGAAAEIMLDAFPEKPFSGVVTFISPEAEFTPRNVQTKEERVNLVFEVKIAIHNPADAVRPGIPADVYIEIEE